MDNRKAQIKKVCGRKDGARLVFVNRKSDILPGDYVLIKKINMKNLEVSSTA